MKFNCQKLKHFTHCRALQSAFSHGAIGCSPMEKRNFSARLGKLASILHMNNSLSLNYILIFFNNNMIIPVINSYKNILIFKFYELSIT